MIGCLLAAGLVRAAGDDVEPAPAASDQRILGIIPNYQTVNDPNSHVAPLTTRQKWNLFLREAIDPFNAASAALGAGFSQRGDQAPRYGEGGLAYADRFGAAMADFTSQEFFSAAVLAPLLHQDPRYFRRGPESGVLKRIGYAFSRVVITRQDSGRTAFNYSGVLGMSLGIAASNLYYPQSSISGEVVATRFGTSVLNSALGNLLSEFWPDIHEKFFHHKKP